MSNDKKNKIHIVIDFIRNNILEYQFNIIVK